MKNITFLEWDSNFFGKKIADLAIPKGAVDMARLKAYVADEAIQLVQACVDIRDQEDICVLEDNGFHFVDMRVLLNLAVVQNISADMDMSVFKRATLQDMPMLERAGRGIFTEHSRYSRQKLFDTVRVDDFYVTWIENAIKAQHDDMCYMLQAEDDVLGFVTLRHVSSKTLRIGLIGVAKDYQHKGIGRQLLQFVKFYANDHGFSAVKVVTEGKNLDALRFYLRHGWEISELKSWYYLEGGD